MRTQREIEIDSLQQHIRNAHQIAVFLGKERVESLLREAFDAIATGDVKDD